MVTSKLKRKRKTKKEKKKKGGNKNKVKNSRAQDRWIRKMNMERWQSAVLSDRDGNI